MRQRTVRLGSATEPTPLQTQALDAWYPAGGAGSLNRLWNLRWGLAPALLASMYHDVNIITKLSHGHEPLWGICTMCEDILL